MNDTATKLALDDTVSKAVRKRPGESIVDACRRIMHSPHGDPAWRVARIILSEKPRDPWKKMARAAKAARRLPPPDRPDEPRPGGGSRYTYPAPPTGGGAT